MAKFRKLAALLACAIMASSVTGCTDTKYSAKIGDDEVKAGVYIAYLSNIMSNEITTLYYQGITEKPFDQQIDGVPLSQYVKDNSLKSLKEYCAITKQFEAEGLTITDDEMKTINTNLRTSWDSMGKLYEYEGVSKESLKELYIVSLKKEKLFDHYYDKGGKEEVTDDELQKYINENYLRYKIITFYTSETDEAKLAEEKETKQKQRDEFFDKGSNLSFADFDQLIKEYQEMNKTTTDDSTAQDDSSSNGNSESSSDGSSESSSGSSSESKDDTSSDASSADDSSNSDDSQASVDSSNDDSSKDESSVPDGSSEDSSSQQQNDSSSEPDSSEPEKEKDPYENEVVMNFATYKDDTESPSGKLYQFIKDLEVGKVAKFENDYGYYIVIKGDITERTDYLEKNRDNVLHAAKDEAFQTMLDGWVGSANITINDKAIKRYTPEVIYDRMNEYYEKNQTTN